MSKDYSSTLLIISLNLKYSVTLSQEYFQIRKFIKTKNIIVSGYAKIKVFIAFIFKIKKENIAIVMVLIKGFIYSVISFEVSITISFSLIITNIMKYNISEISREINS